jgi:hypothetical protein
MLAFENSGKERMRSVRLRETDVATEMRGAMMKLMEQELEPETVNILDEIRRVDPGEQRAVAQGLPAKLIAGVSLSRLGLSMAPFSCHLRFAPVVGALFCQYEGEGLAEQIGIEFEHWKTLGLDLKVMQGMVRTYYKELRLRVDRRLRQNTKGKEEVDVGGGGVRHEAVKARRFVPIETRHQAVWK